VRRQHNYVGHQLLVRGALTQIFAAPDRAAAGDTLAHTIDGMTALTVTYWLALAQGIGSVLRGRPVRPAIRTRS
jgi:hypothetical protein